MPNSNSTQPDKKTNIIDILKIVLPVLGTIIVAIIGYFGIRTQIFAPTWITQTAQVIHLTQTAQSLFNATPTQNPTPAASLTPLPTPSKTPEIVAEAVVPTDTPEPKVVFILPETDELSSLSVLHYDYLNSIKPTTRTYYNTIRSNESYLWKYFWCAKYEGDLQKNLLEVDFVFMVDDVIVPEENFRKYRTYGGTGAANEGWVCQAWATILTQWSRGETIKFSVFFTITRPLSDGENTYQPGDYRHDIIVLVE